MKILSLIVLLVVAVLSDKPKIRVLNEKNLEMFAKDNSYWFIQISNGRCSECASHEGVLEEVAHMFDGVMKVGKIDAKLIPTLKIEKNPTYMFTRSDQPQNSTPYQGGLERKEIAKFCLEQLSNFVKKRAGSKPSGSSSGSSGQRQQQSRSRSERAKGSSSSQSSSSSSSVIELSDSVFEEKVLRSSDAWLVQFYSPGCGHCRNFQPEYSKLPRMIGKRVHIARVDGSKNQQYMGKYQVKGFPTVLLFDTQNKGQPIPYNGERTADAVVEWLKTQNINEEKKQVFELSKATYNQECNRNIVCLVFILDRKSEKSKLRFLDELLVEQAGKPFRFFYSERLPQFESDLMIEDRDTPKMVGIWDSLGSYKIYNGELSHEGLSQFLKTALQRHGWIRYHSKFSQALFEAGSAEL